VNRKNSLPRIALSAQKLNLGTQTTHLRLERQNLTNTRQVDTFFDRQALHFTKYRNIPLGIAPATTSGSACHTQAEPIVLTQRLRMHFGALSVY
jgi:hypothetical protein